MEKIVANLSGKVQTKMLQNREYLVAPVSMLVEGVFAGNQGALYYDGAELAKSANAWNARPLMIGHPADASGSKVSGCTPEAMESSGIGMILNTKWNKTKKKLVAEAWFDVERLKATDDGVRIMDALNKNTPLEVSTGLFVDNEMVSGEFDGKAYVAKAKNFKPDHLAILLNEVGACSLADGAGLLVNAADRQKKNKDWMLVLNSDDESLGQVIDAVTQAVYAKYGKNGNDYVDVWVVEVYEDHVIYMVKDQTWSENFTQDDGSVILLENRMQVTRKVTYEPLVPVTNTKVNMSKETLTKALGDAHKDFVAGLSDAQVSAILGLQTPVTNSAPAPKTVEELVEKAPADLQATLKEALATNSAHRKGLVDLIVANEKNTFTEAELLAMGTPALNKLAVLATNAKVEAPAPEVKPVLHAGQPAPVTNSGNKVQEGFLPLSTY